MNQEQVVFSRRGGDTISPIDSTTARLRFWTRDSSFVLGFFFLAIFLIVYFWWPLAASVWRRMNWDGRWWLHIDWLLIGIFLFMTLTIIARANIKKDILLIFVGICGGFAIEAWGTQTNLWVYYTAERPPLWIIPAWAISNLSNDRIALFLDFFITKIKEKVEKGLFFPVIYWIVFILFMFLMVPFVITTIDKSHTVLALLLCVGIILTPTNYRYAVLIFLAGAGLGYFLELWGTTRHCWTYYTQETPPLFAIFAHGMAAVAFWRAGLVLKWFGKNIHRSFVPIVALLQWKQKDVRDSEKVEVE